LNTNLSLGVVVGLLALLVAVVVVLHKVVYL
jgi:hypothetical protein